MELKKMISTAKNELSKFKFAAIVLVIGIAFLLLPNRVESKNISSTETKQPEETSLAERLEQIISMIDGAGTVRVLLTTASGEEILFQTDGDSSQTADTSSVKTTTVTVTQTDKEEVGLIKQINPPEYLGAIIVCQGADKPSVKLSIVDAVSKATGLGADRISVLKMK